MKEALIIAIVAVCSYLFGNINVALTISKFMKDDVRTKGSGNPGTMNMARSYGVKFGALTLVLDAVKGVIPCLLGWFFVGGLGFGTDRLGAYLGALCVILGHVFPVFLKFKGGKGIASTIGICLVIQPIATLIAFAVALTFIMLTSLGSIASFIAISVPIALEGLKINNQMPSNAIYCSVLIFSLLALTLFAHRKNVLKLFMGTESRTVVIKKKKKNVT